MILVDDRFFDRHVSLQITRNISTLDEGSKLHTLSPFTAKSVYTRPHKSVHVHETRIYTLSYVYQYIRMP